MIDNGQLLGWGESTYGQLGVSVATTTKIAPVPAFGYVVGIAAGEQHTLTLTGKNILANIWNF